MQPLAREMNLSETVFVLPAEADGHARIRIFTPALELPFAGHPMLGTAFVLAAPLQLDEIVLETGAGLVPVRLERDGPRIVFGRMTQPLPTWSPYEREAELLAALGVDAVAASRRGLRPRADVRVRDAGLARDGRGAAAERRRARPSTTWARTASPAPASRWKSRMFAPFHGVAEDPATGSAAGPLAVHLARHGRIGWGDEIEISQGEEIGRPSTLHARADGDGDRVERVEVGGSAVVVARGEFRL